MGDFAVDLGLVNKKKSLKNKCLIVSHTVSGEKKIDGYTCISTDTYLMYDA